MRNEPCQIGSIRPRRQARERRSLQFSKQRSPLENNGFWCGPPGEFNPSWEWVRPDRTYPRRGRLSQTVATSTTYTNTVTRGSTARATHRAVPLPNRRRPPKVLVCLQKLILCPPFRTHASTFSWLHPSINFTMFCREKLMVSLSTGTTTDSASFVRRVWTLWKSNVFVALWVRGGGEWCETM